ncbi:MAG: coproporphyrinogen III oxidase family protein, partial [Atopobiaceae bacterium]|nr:coproporphyrinogen III oxidase family protein [Atopobiaceae bacterium]
RCAYCDFASSATAHDNPLMAAYGESLERMLREVSAVGLLAPAGTAYIGGGTPTMLGSEQLGRLVSCAHDAMAPRELSIEANPESLTDEVLESVSRADATRVSIGVQSLDDRELVALGRIHDAALARDRLAAAVESGLDVSADLMCGIPYQTSMSWQASLAGVLDAGVSHLSCYPLMVEDGTPLMASCDAGELPWPDDDTEATFMEAAERACAGHGLTRYEVASYAREGHACEHNIAYWTGVGYLGLGTQAASMVDREGYERLRGLASRLPGLPEDIVRVRLRMASSTREIASAARLADVSWEVEGLTAQQALAEDLMLAARMSRGIPAALVARARAILGERVDACFATLVDECLLELKLDGSYAPTERGWLMGNDVYGPLWGLADPKTLELSVG